MAKYIPIHPKDKTFVGLMENAAKALRTGNKKLLGKVKKEFAEANIKLFYNQETDFIRVLKKDAPAIDFPVSQFSTLPEKAKK